MRTTVTITIDYKVTGSDAWYSINLSPEEYFELDQGEEVKWDCVPKHNHAVDYVDIDYSNISITRLHVYDSGTQVGRSIIETFWNNGTNRLIEHRDIGLNMKYYELILESLINESPRMWEIVRFDKRDEVLMPNYHGFITENADGSQTERKIRIG